MMYNLKKEKKIIIKNKIIKTNKNKNLDLWKFRIWNSQNINNFKEEPIIITRIPLLVLNKSHNNVKQFKEINLAVKKLKNKWLMKIYNHKMLKKKKQIQICK